MANSPIDAGFAPANSEALDDDPYRIGFDEGTETATLDMARAWIDRWKAAGGDFGRSFNPDGSLRGSTRGMSEPRFWKPTDEGNPKLEPHQWLIEAAHQSGAVKILDSLLTLVPGLQDAVFEIVGAQLPTAAQREA